MRTLALLCLFVLSSAAAAADDAAAAGKRPFVLFTDEKAGKIIRYGVDGSVLWEHPAAIARDAWQLAGGNVLYAYNDDYNARKNDNPSGVIEVTPDHKIIFHFKTTGQVFSCQRLADGNTLVGHAGQGKLLIVSPRGEVVKEIKIANVPGHSAMRNARGLENGHFLVAEESAKAAREYDPAGKLVREFKTHFPVYSAIRLADGRTIACGLKSMIEFDAKGEKAWTLEAAELPAEVGIRWFAGLNVLPNGNLFICNAGGKVPLLEITRDKKVVWQSTAWKTAAPIGIGHSVQRLDVEMVGK